MTENSLESDQLSGQSEFAIIGRQIPDWNLSNEEEFTIPIPGYVVKVVSLDVHYGCPFVSLLIQTTERDREYRFRWWIPSVGLEKIPFPFLECWGMAEIGLKIGYLMLVGRMP